MADLTDLTTASGTELTAAQINGILNQIDLDIFNLVRDGKLAASKYYKNGSAGAGMDRSLNLQELRKTRESYQKLLDAMPAEHYSQYDDPHL